jgi:hypothetical protein
MSLIPTPEPHIFSHPDEIRATKIPSRLNKDNKDLTEQVGQAGFSAIFKFTFYLDPRWAEVELSGMDPYLIIKHFDRIYPASLSKPFGQEALDRLCRGAQDLGDLFFACGVKGVCS